MLKEIKAPNNIGDERIIKKFSYFPIYEYKKSDGKYYFCWWEYYYIKEKLFNKHYTQSLGPDEIYPTWVVIDRWID